MGPITAARESPSAEYGVFPLAQKCYMLYPYAYVVYKSTPRRVHIMVLELSL